MKKYFIVFANKKLQNSLIIHMTNSIFSSRTNNYLLLILLSIIWGGQFLANDLSLRQLSPLSICAMRTVLGLLTLQLIIFFMSIKPQNNPKNSPKMWLFYALLGLFEIVLPMYLIPWGQQRVASSMAAVLIATIPIFTIFITAFIPRENLNIKDWITVILGFTAMIILSGITQGNIGFLNELEGELAVLGGSLCLAIFMVLAKLIPANVSPLIATRNFLWTSCLMIVPFAAVYDKWWLLPHLNSDTTLSMLFLGTQCTGTAFVILMFLIERAGPVFASFTNYLVPFTGISLGVVFLHEKLDNTYLLAIGLIFLGLFIREYNFKNLINKR